MNLPDCEWYNVENIPSIENVEGFVSNVVEPFREHGEYVAHAYRGEIGDYIKSQDISKPQFEKAVLMIGLADNWTQAQGYWNRIWIEGL